MDNRPLDTILRQEFDTCWGDSNDEQKQAAMRIRNQGRGKYAIAVRKVMQNGSLEHGTKPVFVYVIDERYGRFSDRKKAKAAYIKLTDPELSSATDDWCCVHFDAMARNLKYAKVVRA